MTGVVSVEAKNLHLHDDNEQLDHESKLSNAQLLITASTTFMILKKNGICFITY